MKNDMKEAAEDLGDATAPQANPLVAGVALLALGLLLRQWQPRALTLPDRRNATHRDRGLKRVARRSRDGLAAVIPSNLTGSIGRSLIFVGAGLIALRGLDALVEDDDALF